VDVLGARLRTSEPARPELIPYWLAVHDQSCIVIPQTPRRVGAFRPVVSSAVASFACAEPDARLFPLFAPGDEFHGVGRHLGSGDETVPGKPLVAPEWIAAAASLGIAGEPEEIAKTVFAALCGIMNSPDWLATHAVESDTFLGYAPQRQGRV